MHIDQEIEECPYCSAIRSLKYESTAIVWRWDLELPDDWQYPQWEVARLFPTQVPQPVLRCRQCGEHIKVIPSFIQQSTTLTLSALIFVTFAYEFSNLTWRDLPQKFCEPHNRIAHSTLYKAVHGIGRLIHSDAEFRTLCEEYLPAIKTIPHWPPPKSVYEETVMRELGIRLLIRFLLPYHQHISQVFDRFVIALERMFVDSNKQIPVLYEKNRQKGDIALNTA